MWGATWQELGFVGMMVVIVVLAPIAPKLGEAIGGLFERSGKRD